MPRPPSNPAEDFYRDHRCRCNHLSTAHDLDGCHAGELKEMRCGCLGYAPVEPVSA